MRNGKRARQPASGNRGDGKYGAFARGLIGIVYLAGCMAPPQLPYEGGVGAPAEGKSLVRPSRGIPEETRMNLNDIIRGLKQTQTGDG